jgi:hypothetical protein
MQRYRPDIAWPLTGKPWPTMAEDSEAGEYYHVKDVERLRAAFDFLLPLVHVDVRDRAIQIAGDADQHPEKSP